MRYRTLLLSSVLVGIAIVACSYGTYDGRYDAGVADGGDGGAEVGVVVLSRTLDPAALEVLTTPEGAFTVTFAPGTFDGPAKVTISRLANRTLTNLVVPAYGVVADKEPALPFEVKFIGSNPNGGNTSQALVTAFAGADGTFNPTPMVGGGIGGGGGGGGGGEFWGLARRLGTFSLVYASVSQNRSFIDVTSDSCMAKCCQVSGGGATGTAGAIGESCACAGLPNLQCFLSNCVPNVAAAIERCVEVGKIGSQVVSCTSSLPVPQCQGGPP